MSSDAAGTPIEREIPDEAALEKLVGQLDLTEKVRLLTGQDMWSTHAMPQIGLRSMVLSDGPSGVRGATWDERSPSLNLPSATALSSSWDLDLAREYGRVAAFEARRKGVDVVLGPTINLHRSPLGGRHFEAFSEDPVLTAELAAAYVEGLQGEGVAATPKHYVANDFETERFTADVVVSDRALRELYLLAFEKSVTDAGAWLVMSAYNSINGATASENELLETPLNSEWGFDGVVVSDWTAVRSVESARHSQDLEMPGPRTKWGRRLVDAVERGDIPMEAIDRKIVRLLRLAARVGALDSVAPPPDPAPVDGVAFIRRAEAAGMVLVANDGILPLTTPPATIAVIGDNAHLVRTQGGGSATVLPDHVVSPLEGVTEAFGEARVEYSVGAIVRTGLTELPIDEVVDPTTGEQGVRVRFLDGDDAEIFTDLRQSTSYVWLGGDAPVDRLATLAVEARWTPSETATVQLAFAGAGHGTVTANGAVVLDATAVGEHDDVLGGSLLDPPIVSTPFDVVAGEPVEISIRYQRTPVKGGFSAAMSFGFGTDVPDVDPEPLIADAVASAEAAEVVVLVVGTNSHVESEGYDRTDLRLPGHQDELARRVIAANPRTIVVVNSGSPVDMPWAGDAAAVLLGWFGGQEMGRALGDVLTGAVEPGGRLPTTWAREMADVPVLSCTPVDGEVRYDEDIHVGYRAWLRTNTSPAWWFGHGLGYTTWDLGAARADATVPEDGPVTVTVPVTNTGARRGRHVVQIYLSRPASVVDRPVRWLAAFAAVEADPGETVELEIEVPRRAFAHWDNGWAYEPGDFELVAGSSAVELGTPFTVRV
ncbi:MAG: glycoside hydrolase family 3 C-terminal domain-containing protein [Actinomycetota bacterium]|nr:glycoside hydrolase family 3 C-terminal domain-containing protein [Actinomycetota bacterium]